MNPCYNRKNLAHLQLYRWSWITLLSKAHLVYWSVKIWIWVNPRFTNQTSANDVFNSDKVIILWFHVRLKRILPFLRITQNNDIWPFLYLFVSCFVYFMSLGSVWYIVSNEWSGLSSMIHSYPFYSNFNNAKSSQQFRTKSLSINFTLVSIILF